MNPNTGKVPRELTPFSQRLKNSPGVQRILIFSGVFVADYRNLYFSSYISRN